MNYNEPRPNLLFSGAKFVICETESGHVVQTGLELEILWDAGTGGSHHHIQLTSKVPNMNLQIFSFPASVLLNVINSCYWLISNPYPELCNQNKSYNCQLEIETTICQVVARTVLFMVTQGSTGT